MLLLEGTDHAEVCRLCRQVSEGTKGNKPEDEVRESRMTTAEEHKILKRAHCGPAKNKQIKEKKGNHVSSEGSFVMNTAVWFQLFPFFPNEQLRIPEA